MHVTCQLDTQNFYIAQHFKIKGNYVVERYLRPYNLLINTTKCRLEETRKPPNYYIFYFQCVMCR
ncbi:hypothetical protein FDP61_16020 [Enterobacter ludwigii]|nr:hypothetical protein AM379_07120 [Enterobacter cloacae complex sp. FDA-CDC-AR_0132]KAA0510227.1 hypothetical protein F0325_22900 [Enterobacter ludwigii]KAB5484570.1 hypothetical protein F8561_01130 [Enterobacter sp. 198]MRI50840.1 hypothetical protein [Enterobacter ludwigii]QCR94983.1 hypothetical protein ELJP6_21350 [Enterobacter ludwigii]